MRWSLGLISFCEQDHAEFQIIFGVADANDEAGPIALIGCVCAGLSSATVVMSAMTMCARVMLHRANHQPLQRLGSAWVLALSDVFGMVLWAWSFVTHRVQWRNVQYSVHGDACVEARPDVTSVGESAPGAPRTAMSAGLRAMRDCESMRVIAQGGKSSLTEHHGALHRNVTNHCQFPPDRSSGPGTNNRSISPGSNFVRPPA